MDLQIVKDLAQLMEEKGLTSVEIEQNGEHICLKKEKPGQLPTMPLPVETTAVPAVQPPASPENNGVVDFNNVTEVKAPMVGTAYLASAPDAEPYVQVGDKVKKGQVLCVIEAMKLMNELTAPCAGEVVDICVGDGQLVEYGQCLFKLY